MSSEYRILCMSHDPAIVVPGDDVGVLWRSPALALEAIRERSGPAELHAKCDLLVGRYSYPLIEVCCPRSTPSSTFHNGYHPHSDEWIDAGWLRLLALSEPAAREAARRLGCWTHESAHRLRHELEIEVS